MKIYKCIFLLSSIFISSLGFSQVSDEIEVTKKNVFKVFKSTMYQPEKNSIFTVSNPWFTDETKYMESDTLKFVNSSNYNRHFCKVINWTFYKKNKFIRSYGNYCVEPPSEKVTTQKDYFELEITKSETETFLTLFTSEKISEKFEIITLQKKPPHSYKNDVELILTLKRIK